MLSGDDASDSVVFRADDRSAEIATANAWLDNSSTPRAVISAWSLPQSHHSRSQRSEVVLEEVSSAAGTDCGQTAELDWLRCVGALWEVRNDHRERIVWVNVDGENGSDVGGGVGLSWWEVDAKFVNGNACKGSWSSEHVAVADHDASDSS